MLGCVYDFHEAFTIFTNMRFVSNGSEVLLAVWVFKLRVCWQTEKVA